MELFVKESIADANPWFKSWWDYLHSISKSIASREAARRYYSAKKFAISGVPNVFSPLHLCLITSSLIYITIPSIALVINH
ncbi:MAG TPA: hypothetical protein VKA98_06360 [Nitrososphaeraceae archaeon]|nr:hypothetical protein [Nitrososphaeraceae archaeon]